MLSTKQLAGVRVYRTKERRNKDDKVVRLGKVHQVVFAPGGRAIAGVTVRRPDIAGMIKQDDVFVPLDRLEAYDKGLLVTGGDDSYDQAARDRLGIDWDACLIWDGMDARTESGRELGYVGEVTFEAKSGRVNVFRITDGGISNALVGCVEIPSSMVRRYERGFLVVDDAAAHLELSGGAAGKAGAAYGKAKIKGKEAGKKAKKAGEEASKKASEVASVAFDKGTHGLGKALGKARRAMTEAMQEDADPAERRLEEVRVEEPPRSLPQPEEKEGKKKSGDGKKAKKAKKGTDKGGKKGKKKSAKHDSTVTATKGEKADDSGTTELADRAAREVGRQLERTRGMFADFMREFDESSS